LEFGEILKLISEEDDTYHSWFVVCMTTDKEMETGLNHLPRLIKHNGALFDFGEWKQTRVDTSGMLFNIDIVYFNIVPPTKHWETDYGIRIASLEVIDIVKGIEPGYIVSQESLARFVLEMNAGESDVINIGDRYWLETSGYIPLGYMPLSN